MPNNEGERNQHGRATGGHGARDERDAWQELRVAKEYAEAIVETLHEPLLVLTPDLRVKSANPAFYSHFEVTPDEAEGTLIYRLGNDQWDIPELRRLLEDVLPDSNVFNDFEVTHDFEGIGRRTMLVNARRLDHVQLILLGIRDVSERDRAAEAMREREERQAFLLGFSDALRAQPDAQSIKDQAVKMLAEHLRLDRCFISEVFEQQEFFTVGPEQVRPGLPPMKGVYQLSDYPETMRRLATQPMVVDDANTDLSASDSEKALLAAMSMRALLVAPLRKGPRDVVWALAGAMVSPRQWTEGERLLLEDVAERTWVAVERARAEEALRVSEQRYRTLFEAMDEAFAVVEVIPDDEGKWVDFLFLDVNPAFIEHTGMEYPAGRTAKQLLGTPNPRWAEVYGQVAETGEPVRFEEQEMTLGRTFDLYVFRLGEPGSRRVAVLFSDITERKETEEMLRRLTETLEARVRERTGEVRTLASRVLLAEQRERERIAQLLHDDVQQTLHSLNIRIHHLVTEHGIDRENNEEVAEALMILRSAIRGTRSLSAVINPPVLQHGGLSDALRWLADHMREWHDLSVNVHLDLDEPVEIDEVRRLLAFHSVRELLFNVVKHAGVQYAELAARLEGDELVLEVIDEGSGFDVEEALARKPAGFGLATIRERVRFHGGDLEVDSTQGRGTRKTLRMPVV